MTTYELEQIGNVEDPAIVRRADFFGIPVVDLPLNDLVGELKRRLLRRESTHIVNLNPHHFLIVRDDDDFGRIFSAGDIVFADGIGIVIASAMGEQSIFNRYTGLDVMVRLCELSAREHHSVFLFGGQNNIVERCAANLRDRFPGLKIAGTFDPPFVGQIEEFDNDRIVRAIREAKPDMLFVALGAPKQEKWIERFRSQLNVPILMGVGGSFDILGGRFPRAPRWMQSLGLEWLFRLGVEPRRLAGRYLIGIPRFLLLVLRLRLRAATNRSS